MRAVVAAIVLVLAAAPSALAAGTIARSGANDSLTYATATAADVLVTDAPDGMGGVVVTVSEAGISITGPANGCMDTGESIACPFAAGNDPDISANLTAQGDTFNAGGASLTTLTIDGLAGEDTLTGGNDAQSRFGSPTGDSIFPGTGADRVFAGDGDDQVGMSDDGGDVVDLGAGDDRLITVYAGADPAADALTGGLGRDQYYPRFATVDLTAFTVDLAAGTSVDSGGASVPDPIAGFEDLRTDQGNDILLGDAGPNVIMGGAGNDRLEGRLGSDQLSGEFDDDRVEAQDGVADRVDGGPGADTCLLDQLDEDAECEARALVSVTPFGVALPDLTAPVCTSATAQRPRARAVARRGLVVAIGCDEPGTVVSRLVAGIRRLDGRVRPARAGDIELARRSATLGDGGRATLQLRVGRRYRRLLRAGARLRVEVSAVDQAGNRASPRVRRLRLR